MRGGRQYAPGAQDFLGKPVAPERLAVSLANVMKLAAIGDDPARVLERAEPESESSATPLLLDAAMSMQCEKHAKSDMPLLIEGEAGTGKTVRARLIHRTSARRKKPCVTISAEDTEMGSRAQPQRGFASRQNRHTDNSRH